MLFIGCRGLTRTFNPNPNPKYVRTTLTNPNFNLGPALALTLALTFDHKPNPIPVFYWRKKRLSSRNGCEKSLFKENPNPN